MSENNEKKVEETKEKVAPQKADDSIEKDSGAEKDIKISIEEKLKISEEKSLRLLAEIENQRRRFEKEIKDAFEFGSFNFAKESLSILDNLQRAKEAIKNDNVLKDNKDLEKFLENITIIEKDLMSIFEKNNIKKIDAKGKKFDPNLHQAMTEIEDDKSETGKILQEIQPGYMLGDRLLRPALVGVAKRNNSKNNEKNEKKVKK